MVKPSHGTNYDDYHHDAVTAGDDDFYVYTHTWLKKKKNNYTFSVKNRTLFSDMNVTK